MTLTDIMFSDSAVKQILLTMNEKQSFIIEDLDDHHLVIKADEEWRVRKELEAEVRFRPFPKRCR
jgi:TFIIH basal transcription factor complex TTD-A subunit